MVGETGALEMSKDEVIERAWITLRAEEYAEVMRGERYHNHLIIEDELGTYRWKQFPARKAEIMDYFGATDLNELFSNGADKNDPLVRELYRCMGYSIFGYWEVFYWEVNNHKVEDWLNIVDHIAWAM